MKEVTSAEFDERMKRALRIKPCSNCSATTGNIVMLDPFYGRRGVRVSCKTCGAMTSLKRDTDCFSDESRLGSPVTAESLAKAIFEAVEEWNNKQADRQE